jgi:hypothetical protein
VIKYNLVDLVEHQRQVESVLWDAERKQGIWEYSKNSEQDRLDEIANFKEKLKPVNLIEIHLPQLPLVKVAENASGYGLKKGDVYVVLGEIAQMPGHVVVLNHNTGEVKSGYHTENFEIIPVNEA